MRWAEVLILPLLFTGGVLVALGLALGEGRDTVFLSLPLVALDGPYTLAGTLVAMTAFLVAILAVLRHPGRRAPSEGGVFPPLRPRDETIPSEATGRRMGGVVALGRFPLLLGASLETTRSAAVLVGVVSVFLLFLLLLGTFG